jgi:hypothetical protein
MAVPFPLLRTAKSVSTTGSIFPGNTPETVSVAGPYKEGFEQRCCPLPPQFIVLLDVEYDFDGVALVLLAGDAL